MCVRARLPMDVHFHACGYATLLRNTLGWLCAAQNAFKKVKLLSSKMAGKQLLYR